MTSVLIGLPSPTHTKDSNPPKGKGPLGLISEPKLRVASGAVGLTKAGAGGLAVAVTVGLAVAVDVGVAVGLAWLVVELPPEPADPPPELPGTGVTPDTAVGVGSWITGVAGGGRAVPLEGGTCPVGAG